MGALQATLSEPACRYQIFVQNHFSGNYHFIKSSFCSVENEAMSYRYGTTSITSQMFGKLIRVAGSYGGLRQCPVSNVAAQVSFVLGTGDALKAMLILD